MYHPIYIKCRGPMDVPEPEVFEFESRFTLYRNGVGVAQEKVYVYEWKHLAKAYESCMRVITKTFRDETKWNAEKWEIGYNIAKRRGGIDITPTWLKKAVCRVPSLSDSNKRTLPDSWV